MAAPKSGVFAADENGGVVFDYTNDTETSIQPEYVEFTAPNVCRLQATIDGELVAQAWAGAGGAHSWWTAAGGRFFRYPLKPGQRLVIALNGEGVVVVHWYE